MRGAAGAVGFLAHAIFSVDDRRLLGVQSEAQIKIFADGLQLLIGTFPLNVPVSVPDSLRGFVHAGAAGSGAIGALQVIKAAV